MSRALFASEHRRLLGEMIPRPASPKVDQRPAKQETIMRFVCVPLAAFLASCAIDGPPSSDSRSRETIERVFDAFNNCKIEELVSNYSDDNLVFFTPGTPEPVVSRAGLRKYFSYLTDQPCSSPQSAKHTNITLKVRPVGGSAAVVHANTVVKYVDEGAAQSVPFYFTFVVQEVNGQWLVISQNAQRVPSQ